MTTQNNLPFCWEQVDKLSDLRRLELVLDALPDDDIIRALSAMRKNGRNEYPVYAMWRALIAGIVFQHESIESLTRELDRNSSLLKMCGFCPIPLQRPARYEVKPGEGEVIAIDFPPRSPAPKNHTFSRFLLNIVKIEEERGLISKMIATMRKELMELLPDFGKRPGYDGKAIESHCTGQKNRKSGETSDPDADWGKHETKGVDSNGRQWTKVKIWFGYRLHVIADTKYEIPVAFNLTRASASEIRELERMTESLFTEDPEIEGRCRYLSADRGLDSGEFKKKLWEQHQVRPVIDNRELWRQEKEGQSYVEGQKVMRPLGSVHDNIFYTERAEILCRCPVRGEERKMVFSGFEKDRGSLKYRCPDAVYNFGCEGWEKCHGDAGCATNGYGRVVRVPLKKNHRIFTPTPRSSVTWKREYRRRSSLERIYSGMDNSFGFEKHYIRGKAKMTARVGLALAVMMALAVGHIKAGRPECMRSLAGGSWARAG